MTAVLGVLSGVFGVVSILFELIGEQGSPAASVGWFGLGVSAIFAILAAVLGG